MEVMKDNRDRHVFTIGGDQYLMLLPRMEVLTAYLQMTLDSYQIPGSLWDNACKGQTPNGGNKQKNPLYYLKQMPGFSSTCLGEWITESFPVMIWDTEHTDIVESYACRCNKLALFNDMTTVWRDYHRDGSQALSPWFNRKNIRPLLVPLDKDWGWDCERLEHELPNGTITKGGMLYVEGQPRSQDMASLPFLYGSTPFWIEDTSSDEGAIEWVSIYGMLLARHTLFHCYRHDLRSIFGKP